MVVVTGGGSGLGRGAALAFARRGAKAFLVDLNLETAEETAQMVRRDGGEAAAFRQDVSEPDAFETVRQAVLQTFGGYHIVMNNVSVIACGRVEDTPLSEWERVIDINLMATVRSVKAFLQGLLAQGEGHIVNVASTAGLFPYAYDRLSYAASKAAVISLSEGLALYCRPRGVGVSVFCPGPMRTNMGKQIKLWGPPNTPRGPGAEFEFVSLEAAGEMLVNMVVEDRFVGYTHPEQSLEKIRRKYADWDGFIKSQAAQIAEEERAGAGTGAPAG